MLIGGLVLAIVFSYPRVCLQNTEGCKKTTGKPWSFLAVNFGRTDRDVSAWYGTRLTQPISALKVPNITRFMVPAKNWVILRNFGKLNFIILLDINIDLQVWILYIWWFVPQIVNLTHYTCDIFDIIKWLFAVLWKYFSVAFRPVSSFLLIVPSPFRWLPWLQCLWDVFSHPCTDLNIRLDESSVKLDHWRIIFEYYFIWV